MITTEGYMFCAPLVGFDGETQQVKKLNHYSFFGTPFYHWFSGHCKKFLVLFPRPHSEKVAPSGQSTFLNSGLNFLTICCQLRGTKSLIE